MPFVKKIIETPGQTDETPIETTDTPKESPKWTTNDLRSIVGAGMAIAEATTLLNSGFSPADVLELAQIQASKKVDAAAEAQTATAKAMQKAMRPENEAHPGKSAFSYPEGDAARPRPVPPFRVSLNGYPHYKFPETDHWRELELMCDLQPGTFTVMRKDGSIMKVDVVAERDANGTITNLKIQFPISREEKGLVPPLISLLYQLVHPDNPRQRFLESMREYFEMTIGAPLPV